MNNSFERRTFLKAGAATTLVAGSQLVSFPAWADFAAGPTLRRNASTMAANDPILRGYRTAITRMRALPDTNPCSWFYQAAIHGTTDPRNLASWNTCHTDPSFFLAWHRMYLHFFERIVRKHSGMYDWAIPYWDWANPAERSMPAPFRESTSALFDGSRNAGVNAGNPLSPSLGTAVANAMALTDYFNTQSSVNGPHGSVHIAVSGNMSSVSSAAQDPIFWVHHAEVDRLWNLWLAQGGGRSSPVGNATWRNSTYTFFDECCQPVRMKGCDVLRAARQLSYAYEGEPAQVEQYCPRRPFDVIRDLSVLLQIRRPIPLRRGPVKIPIPPPPPEVRERMLRVLRSPEETLLLRLGGIEAPSQPGISWEVHVGPRGFAPGERSLVGIFALFSAGLRDRQHHYSPAEFVFPIEKAAGDAVARGLEVLLLPVTGREERGDQRVLQPRVPVTIGEVAIVVDAPSKLPPQDEQEQLRREELNQ